jgi:hypothetical protein
MNSARRPSVPACGGGAGTPTVPKSVRPQARVVRPGTVRASPFGRRVAWGERLDQLQVAVAEVQVGRPDAVPFPH